MRPTSGAPWLMGADLERALQDTRASATEFGHSDALETFTSRGADEQACLAAGERLTDRAYFPDRVEALSWCLFGLLAGERLANERDRQPAATLRATRDNLRTALAVHIELFETDPRLFGWLEFAGVDVASASIVVAAIMAAAGARSPLQTMVAFLRGVAVGLGL